MKISGNRLSTWAVCAAIAVVATASPALAQYKPRPLNDPATGETFHIEGDASFWNPTAEMTISSESLGIPGTSIDLKKDLGVTDQRFPALNLQLRPARSHHLRFQYIPISYQGSAAHLTRDVVFNGIRYSINTPVNSTLDWKAYRFGYQYDFLVKNKGFAGVILEAKYTDVKVELDSQFAQEFAHAQAPIPAIGAIGRVYVVPNISITGEFTTFRVPQSLSTTYNAHYTDIDIYGTVNFTDYVGVKAGYRSLDLGYLIKSDTGAFTLNGLYFGAVLRY
ncbi:MAG TPA: hypothetical protein VNG89_07025 [Vicinamibacterales bacterium]|nr:hypothetical protein [Vicinamibacterales bacterium]